MIKYQIPALRCVSMDELMTYTHSDRDNFINRRGIYAIDPQDSTIAYIPLTRGHIAKIDTIMVGTCVRWNWRVQTVSSNITTHYALCYTQSDSTRVTQMMHRIIWETLYGPIDGILQIDHHNGDGLDNRLCNLRLTTPRENQSNRYYHRNGKLLGATFHQHQRMWHARISLNGVLHYIGRYQTEIEAHNAYKTVLSLIKDGIAVRDAITLVRSSHRHKLFMDDGNAHIVL